VPGKASHSPVAADSWRPLDATEPALESEKAPKYRVSLGWSERNFLSLNGSRLRWSTQGGAGATVRSSDQGTARLELAGAILFADDFESGDTSAWSAGI
jgi:hypothetical protein